MSKKTLKYQLLFTCILISHWTYGQMDSLSLRFETGITAGSGENLPFWLQTNRFGMVSNDLTQVYGRIKIENAMNSENNFSLYYGLSLAGNLNSNSDLYFEEYYAGIKFHFLKLEAGAKRKYFRDYHHNLGSGDMIWSGNARPIPQITISTHDYTKVPFTSGWLTFDGGISHGWMDDFPGIEDVLLHHKWLSLKTGNNIPIQFTAGLQHFAQWGGYSEYFGEMPVSPEIFWKVLLAKGGADEYPENEQINAIGNHIGSYHLALDYHFDDFSIGITWQNIFEDNSGRKLRNWPDGLYSLELKTKNKEKWLNGIVLEYLASAYQSGPIIIDTVNNIPYTGGDNYFRNYIYQMGWTSHQRTIGTPFISSPAFYSDEGEPMQIINNRVNAIHLGLSGDMGFFNYIILISNTINKGTYADEFEPHSRDMMLLLNLWKEDLLLKNSVLQLDIGIDRGDFYGNNFGLMLRWMKKLGLNE